MVTAIFAVDHDFLFAHVENQREPFDIDDVKCDWGCGRWRVRILPATLAVSPHSRYVHLRLRLGTQAGAASTLSWYLNFPIGFHASATILTSTPPRLGLISIVSTATRAGPAPSSAATSR